MAIQIKALIKNFILKYLLFVLSFYTSQVDHWRHYLHVAWVHSLSTIQTFAIGISLQILANRFHRNNKLALLEGWAA